MTKSVKQHDQTGEEARPAGVPRIEERPNIGRLLAGPFARIEEAVDAGLREAGFPDVRPAHGRVFQVIAAEGSRVTDLAVRAGMTKQAMTELVIHLERGGYMVRVPDPSDGRARLVRLTRRGWECIAAARAAIAREEEAWAGGLGAEDYAALRRALEDLNARLAVSPQWPMVGAEGPQRGA
jgi:DNA-binding MarR family transcriptional regulator